VRIKRGGGNGRNRRIPPREKECGLNRSTATDVRKRIEKNQNEGHSPRKIRMPAGYEAPGVEIRLKPETSPGFWPGSRRSGFGKRAEGSIN
jgi:hypothetical protein